MMDVSVVRSGFRISASCANDAIELPSWVCTRADVGKAGNDLCALVRVEDPRPTHRVGDAGTDTATAAGWTP